MCLPLESLLFMDSHSSVTPWFSEEKKKGNKGEGANMSESSVVNLLGFLSLYFRVMEIMLPILFWT